MIDTCGIHHWRIFRSSYRNFAWVRFEPTTTEFRSDAVTNWAIRPWVQRVFRANIAQVIQFHLFVQFSHFIWTIVFVSCHICFKRNLAQVITLAGEWLIHMVFATEGFTYIDTCIHIQIYVYKYIYIYIYIYIIDKICANRKGFSW